MWRFISDREKKINLYIHVEFAAQSGPCALTDTIKVMTITPARAERGFILPETCPRPLRLQARPSRTQGYPLSLGKIITLRRRNKSTHAARPSLPQRHTSPSSWYGDERSTCMLAILFSLFCRSTPFAQLAFQQICDMKIFSAAPLPLPSAAPNALTPKHAGVHQNAQCLLGLL